MFVTVSFAIFGLGLISSFSQWSGVSYYYDKFDRNGVMNIAFDMGQIDTPGIGTIPIIMVFSPNRLNSTSFFGQGWLIPALSAYMVQVDDNTFTAMLPDGNMVDFRRSISPELLQGSEGWTGVVSKEDVRITNKGGWSIWYKSGSIRKIVAPNGKSLDVNHAQDEQSITLDGSKVLVVNKGLKDTIGLIFGETKYAISMGSRPIIQDLKGHRIISSMALAPVLLTSKAGERLEFKYGTDDRLQPTLAILGPAAISGLYTWCPCSGQLLSHDETNYAFQTLSSGDKQFTVIEHNQSPQIFQFNPYTLSSKQVNADGSVVEYATFSTSKLNGVPRRGQITRAGKTERVFMLRVDENENPIEEVRRVAFKNQVTKFVYGEKGRLVEKQTLLDDKLQLKEEFAADGSRKLISPNLEVLFKNGCVLLFPRTQQTKQ